ncbi:hypothetical protein M2150_002780 [Lachnospiraceae bacterium PM6-15]
MFFAFPFFYAYGKIKTVGSGKEIVNESVNKEWKSHQPGHEH